MYDHFSELFVDFVSLYALYIHRICPKKHCTLYGVHEAHKMRCERATQKQTIAFSH
jgi:hypothetical protein